MSAHHTTQSLSQLNHEFSCTNNISFVQQGELIIAELRNQHGYASIALQGAQILQWIPNGQTASVIWVSKGAVYQAGKGVRGGVPICWPWFGALEGKGTHGFVRTRPWQVRSIQHTQDDTSIMLSIFDDDSTRAIWDYGFTLNIIITLGAQLSITLETHNTGNQPFTITEALHTYFHIGHAYDTHIIGLENTTYLDKVTNNTCKQVGTIGFHDSEVDSVYIDTNKDIHILDKDLKREIQISKKNAPTTIVWNPGIAKEKIFADMMENDYLKMVCVESGTAGNAQVTVPARSQHSMNVTYQLLTNNTLAQ